MSVVPMKLLTIAGPLERFDDVVRACVIDQEFHPENALQLMRSVKGLRPLELENPYSALLHRSVEVADEAGIPLAYAPFDPASPLEDFASYFDSLSGRIAALHLRWLTLTGNRYDPGKHWGLAALYTEDPRFTAYYDRSVPGCAWFLRAAVERWAETL